MANSQQQPLAKCAIWGCDGNRSHTRRGRGRPRARWEDLLVAFCPEWVQVAKDRLEWRKDESKFAIYLIAAVLFWESIEKKLRGLISPKKVPYFYQMYTGSCTEAAITRNMTPYKRNCLYCDRVCL